MYNFIIKVLKSIFLLIMSILKTLSSNYVPLLVICTIIFYFITFLSQRKLVLPCNNCENGSWYYKCAPHTGFGTRTCRHYTYVINTTEDFLNLLNNGAQRYLKVILILMEHTSRVIKKAVLFIDNLIGILSLLFPPWLVFKYLVHPVTKALFKGLRKATEKLNLFTCAFTIPVINKKLDICKLIITGIVFLLDLVKLVFNTLMDIVSMVGKLIYSFIKKFILDQLVKLISTAFKFITKNIFSLLTKSTQLLTKITKPLNVIFDIPLGQYFILVIDALLNLILDIIPGGQLLRQAPAIILGTIILVLIITIVLPIIGGFIAFFPLIKSILYFILGLDDDNDFKFLFGFIFKLINKIRSLFN